jgi:outer membrane receptor protein involved in Fe transport
MKVIFHYINLIMNKSKNHCLASFPKTAVHQSVKIYSKMAFLAFIGMNGVALHAQNAQSSEMAKEEVSALDAVVVTGTADKKTKAQTSYSITTINQDAIRLQGAASVTESLKSVPGFWVEASGGVASGNIRARGVPVDGFGSVQLLEDGLPVQHDPALGYLNADQVFRLDETLNRIEVVRGGPSTVLYSNAPAGAINYVSRDIGSAPEGLFKFSLSNHGERREDIWYSTPLQNDYSVGMGGFYRVDPGVRNPGFDANKGGQFRIKLAKEIDKGRITLDYKHIDDKVELYLGAPMKISNGSLVAVSGYDVNYSTLAGPETAHVNMITGKGGIYNFDNTVGTAVKRDQITVTFDRDLADNWYVKNSFRYNTTNTTRDGVFPNSMVSTSSLLASSSALLKNIPGATSLGVNYVNAPNTPYVGNGLVVNAGLRGITMPLDEIMNDLHFTKTFNVDGQIHRLTFGDYLASFNQGFQRFSSVALVGAQNQAPLLNIVGLNAAGKVVGSVTDTGIYQYGYEWANAHGQSLTNALYINDDWRIDDKWSVEGGLRSESVTVQGWNEASTKANLGTFPTSQILTGSGTIGNYNQNFNKTGWSLGTNYQNSKHSGVFARYSEAYRLPNLSNYITSPNPATTPPVQTMQLAELGYKFVSEKLDLFPTFFYTKYNNVALTNYVFSLNNTTATPQYLYANTKTMGLELDGTWRANRMFDVGFVVTSEDPKYGNLIYTNSANQTLNYQGNQLIRVPKLNYRITPGFNLLGNDLRIQLAYEYVGQRYVDTANSVMLPSYQVTNLGARYQYNKQTQLFMTIENMFNSTGLTEGNPRAGEVQSADAGANAFIARPLMGRNIRLSLKYDF